MMVIEDYIPTGYRNRVSRGYLVEILHMPDRAVRMEIENARLRGILIASRGGGYFQPADGDDKYFEDYMRAEDSRFKTISHKRKIEREAWRRRHPEARKDQIPGQMELDLRTGW